MRFDASAQTQHGLRRSLGLEPRLLRFSVVKMAERLSGVAGTGGEAEEWMGVDGARGERGLERRAEGDYYIS
jgi:small subunit ribosomal protein S6